MIAFRRAHPILRSRDFFRHADPAGYGYSDISWHGVRAWQPDWGGKAIAFMLCGRYAKGETVQDDFVYVAMNMHWDALPFELPRLPDGFRWRVFANTSMSSPEDVFEPGSEPEISDQAGCLVGGRSVVILVGRSAALIVRRADIWRPRRGTGLPKSTCPAGGTPAFRTRGAKAARV